MENNIYATIQEWHQLFKNGTISEQEFLSKKNELLEFGKGPTVRISKKGKNFSPVLLSIILATSFVGAFCAYFFFLRPIGNEITSSSPVLEYENTNEPYTAYGIYTVDTLITNRAYFHDEPKSSTKRTGYLTPYDNFILDRIENGFAFVEFKNSNGQITKGWLDLDEISECFDCK